jgi:hypothetical protein
MGEDTTENHGQTSQRICGCHGESKASIGSSNQNNYVEVSNAEVKNKVKEKKLFQK